MALPAGLSREGLPIGLQLIGQPFGEESIIKAGYAFEQATDWHKQKANI
jgi:aspartyl-tRNA(Asn)/glutamyl-tRNA(Gln) amidotransferase subunit A